VSGSISGSFYGESSGGAVAKNPGSAIPSGFEFGSQEFLREFPSSRYSEKVHIELRGLTIEPQHEYIIFLRKDQPANFSFVIMPLKSNFLFGSRRCPRKVQSSPCLCPNDVPSKSLHSTNDTSQIRWILAMWSLLRQHLAQQCKSFL
jgi:hypothetical protein